MCKWGSSFFYQFVNFSEFYVEQLLQHFILLGLDYFYFFAVLFSTSECL